MHLTSSHSLSSPLRVAVLVDLPRGPQAGGHVKYWERIAHAVAADSARFAPLLDLTLFFSGAESTEILAPHVRIKTLPPVFSTARLPFLPYMPDTTDLASYHPRLAARLKDFDVVHSTDGFFAFAQTAAKILPKLGIPLVTSFHTDTVAYTEIFTRTALHTWVGWWPWLYRLLNDRLKIPVRQAASMARKLRTHVQVAAHALASRTEDEVMATGIVGKERVHSLRLGYDTALFGVHRADKAGVARDYGLSEDALWLLFVGRVDIGKNVPTLIEGIEHACRNGTKVEIILAGQGPLEDEVRRHLGATARVLGYVKPTELGRLYASVDALALCSEVEIRSMAVVEALASHCPILVSAKSGIAPLFNNSPAFHVITGGGTAWGDAITHFANTPAQQETMRDAARMLATQTLTAWGDVAAEDLLPIWQRAHHE